MPDILRFLGLRRQPRPALKTVITAAAMEHARREWIDAIIRQTSAFEVKGALVNAGFALDAEGGLLRKPGHCAQCRRYCSLSQGLDSGRWLCSDCWLADIAET